MKGELAGRSHERSISPHRRCILASLSATGRVPLTRKSSFKARYGEQGNNSPFHGEPICAWTLYPKNWVTYVIFLLTFHPRIDALSVRSAVYLRVYRPRYMSDVLGGTVISRLTTTQIARGETAIYCCHSKYVYTRKYG